MSQTTNPTKSTSTVSKASARRRSPGRTRTPQLDPAMIDALTADDDAGIDYGAAIEAIDDLLGWAFELARKDVSDWPEGTRRVRNAHRYVRTLLRGKNPRSEPREDLLFTAALLVRIFEGEIGLSADHVAALLDQLGLPLDHVPAVRPMPAASTSAKSIAPSAWRHLRAIHAALPPMEAAAARDEAARLTAPEREAWIATLVSLSVADGARIVSAYLRGECEAAPLVACACGSSRSQLRRFA